MPLIQSKSKKAMGKNIEAEMHAGKPQKQAIAIAYSVKRKNAKKKASGGTVESGSRDMNMAEGGEVNAKNERRPMPENRYDDSKMISRNSGNKAPSHDSWTDNSTITQAQSNNGRKVLPIKRPKMVPTDAFSTRLYDAEGNLQESARPGPYGEQPPKHDDEDGAKRQGPRISDMESEHSTHSAPYKEEIEDQYAQDEAEDDMKQRYAKGGQIEPSDRESRNIKMHTGMEPMDHGIEEDERMEEAHLMSGASPSEDEGSSDAHSMNEEGPDRHGRDVPDMEDEHSTGRKPYAGGGRIGDSEANIDSNMEMNPAHDKHSPDDSEDQPEDEEMLEKHNSIAAAIMARRERRAMQHSDSDIDHEMMMAEGGILSHGSMDSDDSDQADLSRNADEDANEEDQSSFNALRKENYSESAGLRQLDNPRDAAMTGDNEEEDSENKHDMISKIRSKMNMKRQFRVD